MKESNSIWSGRWTFLLAAVGSAVGLGNMWKFPYITGENGGGAFVLVYLICIALAGIPIMIAETLLGRRKRLNPIDAMISYTNDTKSAPGLFKTVGVMGAVAGLLILSFYSVIAGWTFEYAVDMMQGKFVGINGKGSGELFGGLLANPTKLTIWHTVFMLTTAVVIAMGVKKGIEKAISILMPLLFLMLAILFGYSLTTSGFGESLSFLFNFDFSKLTGEAVVVALGHSFFTLSLGMGSIMVYGSYMQKEQNIGKTILGVAFFDTAVALVSGIIIFSLVFTNGLEPGAGPGLMFVTLPIAFGSMPGGVLFGTIFFILVAIAAWSSAISLLEPIVAWAVNKGLSRVKSVIAISGLAWFVGLGSVFSFNIWSEHKIFFGKTFFDALDFLTANIMLPLGGLLIAIFVGWFLKKEESQEELHLQCNKQFNVWYNVLRYVSPIAVLYVFINGLI